MLFGAILAEAAPSSNPKLPKPAPNDAGLIKMLDESVTGTARLVRKAKRAAFMKAVGNVFGGGPETIRTLQQFFSTSRLEGADSNSANEMARALTDKINSNNKD